MHRLWLIALFLAAPLTVLLERMAYYMVRSQMFMRLLDLGLSNEEVSAQYGTVTSLMWFAPLLGGALAIAIGPRITALVGAGLAAVAYVLLVLVPPDALMAVFIIWAIALGLFKPSFYAFVGLQMRDQPETRWGALFVLLLVMVNVGAFIGVMLPGLWRNILSSSLYSNVDITQISFSQAVSLMLSAIAVLTMLVLSAPKTPATTTHAHNPAMPRAAIPRPPMPTPAMPTPAALPGQASGSNEVGILVLLVAVLPLHILLGLGLEYGLNTVGALGDSTQSISSLRSFNGVASIGASVIALLILFVVGGRVRITIAATGASLLLGALSILPLIAAPSYATALIQQFLAAPVELITYGLLLGRASVGTRPRLAALIVSVWFFGTSIAYWLSSKLAELAPVAGLIGCAVICIAIGGAFLALRVRIETTLFPQPNAG